MHASRPEPTPQQLTRPKDQKAASRSCPQWLVPTPTASFSAGEQIALRRALLQVALEDHEHDAGEDEGEEKANEHPDEGFHRRTRTTRDGSGARCSRGRKTRRALAIVRAKEQVWLAHFLYKELRTSLGEFPREDVQAMSFL